MLEKIIVFLIIFVCFVISYSGFSSFVYGYTCEEKYQYCKYDLPNSCSSSDNCSWEIQSCWDEYYGSDGCGTPNTDYGGYSSWDEYCKATYGSDTYYDASTDTCERKRFEFDIDVQTFASISQDASSPISIPINVIPIRGTPQEVNLWTADWRSVGMESWITPSTVFPASPATLWIQPSCDTPPDQYQFGVHGDTAGTTFTSVDSVTVQVTPGNCSGNSNIYSAQINRAKDLIESENYQDAVDVLYDVLMEDPNNVDALLVEADAVAKMGYPEDAISYYDQVIANDPNNIPALSNKASLLIDLERYDEALDAYQRVISLDPSDSNAYNNIGVILGNQGDYEGALKYFESASNIDPNNSLYNENIEFIWEKLGELSSPDDENQLSQEIQVKSFFTPGGDRGKICNYHGGLDPTCRELDGNLQPHDFILTGKDNFATVSLDGGASQIIVGPNSEMAVLEFTEKMRIFYFPTSKLDPNFMMKATIHSPNGVITKFGICEDLTDEKCNEERLRYYLWIRGTELVLEQNTKDSTKITVLEGSVELQDPKNLANSRIIEANNQLEIKHVGDTNIFITKLVDLESIDKWWSKTENITLDNSDFDGSYDLLFIETDESQRKYVLKGIIIIQNNTIISPELFDKGYSSMPNKYSGKVDDEGIFLLGPCVLDGEGYYDINTFENGKFIGSVGCETFTYLRSADVILQPSGGLIEEDFVELYPKNNLQEPNGGGCLIATATYGSELAPQVQQLRELRDNSILQTESGTSFMNSFNQFYYSFSPTIADWERENPAFKEFVKITLTPMISSLSILNYLDMDSEASVLGYGISLILLNMGMYFVAPAVVIVGIRKKFNSN